MEAKQFGEKHNLFPGRGVSICQQSHYHPSKHVQSPSLSYSLTHHTPPTSLTSFTESFSDPLATTILLFSPSAPLQVKIFQQTSGFCFVTFSEHTAPVTAVAFLPSGHGLLSSSLDGTVRAYDLVRYRNFRTMTSPTPVQFGSLAVDPSGEVSEGIGDVNICIC